MVACAFSRPAKASACRGGPPGERSRRREPLEPLCRVHGQDLEVGAHASYPITSAKPIYRKLLSVLSRYTAPQPNRAIVHGSLTTGRSAAPYRQHLADRLDPIRPTVIVDERDHGLNRRSSSAWAQYADAWRRISLACRSSRFSRSSALSFAVTSDETPDRMPLSRPAFFTHSCSVCAVPLILAAIDVTAAQREACSPS
jgi:hypothetical protein